MKNYVNKRKNMEIKQKFCIINIYTIYKIFFKLYKKLNIISNKGIVNKQ